MWLVADDEGSVFCEEVLAIGAVRFEFDTAGRSGDDADFFAFACADVSDGDAEVVGLACI
jgi:hypothetical protein